LVTVGRDGNGAAIPDFRRECRRRVRRLIGSQPAPVRREMDVVISAGARVAGGLPTRRNQPNQSHRSLDVIFHGKARRFAVLQTIALPTELPRRGTQFSWFCSGTRT